MFVGSMLPFTSRMRLFEPCSTSSLRAENSMETDDYRNCFT